MLGALPGCAGGGASKTTVLDSLDDPAELADARIAAAATPELPISLPYRGPTAQGDAYRIVLEISGERAVSVSKDLNDHPPLGESHSLELEYRETATQGSGARDDAYLVSLDALHYQLAQKNPSARREIEISDDRLRVTSDGEESLDLKGAQPKGDLTPRQILQRVFATVVHDGAGNPSAVAPSGTHAARRFLSGFPLKRALGYSRISLPSGPISPGSVWRAQRFPASRAGELGLSLEIEYSLAGFEQLDGVPCAWILLRADLEQDGVRSTAGFEFARVVAHLSGNAWVELETSRLRRMVIEDDIRSSYQRGDGSMTQIQHGLRHATRLLIELRDPNEETDTWSDGSTRFGQR